MNVEIERDQHFIELAFAQACKSYDEGGVPVGAVMVRDDAVIAAGHNRRVQHDDSISHGETDCLRQAGLMDDYSGVTLYTTLSPCMMCTGSVLHFGISRVVIGEAVNFPGNPAVLRDRGVDVRIFNHTGCRELMARFIRERPDIWFEDINGRE